MSVMAFPGRFKGGWFLGSDGRLTNSKYDNEERSYTFRFGGLLDGDTISTATWSMSGAVNEASSNTTTEVTIRVSGIGTGDLEIETTSGDVLEFRFRWMSSDGLARDY
jgi:hypothetical protein